MGDACDRCKGTGKIGTKEAGDHGPSRPCFQCGGTGMVRPGPQGRRK